MNVTSSALPAREHDPATMVPFDFRLLTRIVFGNGAVGQLGELARELGAQRAMVVSDPGIVAAGHAEKGLQALRDCGIETTLFDGTRENPTDREVEAGLSAARAFAPDLLVGLGGGSSLDCAKGINFVYSCGGRIHDYWGIGKATGNMLPMIAIPTTAGTGSELQSFALISDSITHVKMACGDKRATCRAAILDPQLTVTQPAWVTALTGIDAISHAVESYVTRSRSPVSQLFSRQAWRICATGFTQVLRDPGDLNARAAMQWGAALAGLAIENSMLGACHALANPLTARFGVAHGQAIAAMLPWVIEFNSREFRWLYDDLARDIGLECGGERDGHAVADFIRSLIHQCQLKASLSELGVPRQSLSELAAEADQQWTARHNPRVVDAASLLEIYQAAY
jgi:alcohol dehydrogenase